MITIGQQAQHDPVLITRGNNVQSRSAPRHDRCRTGIVRIGLVDPATLEQPHPRRQLRWHIDHLLAGADELLGEHRTHPRRSLDSPGARLEPCRPLQQPASLMPIGVDTDRVDDVSERSTTTTVWDPLCGSIPMMNMSCSLFSWLGSPRQAHLMRVDAVPLTSHTTTGPGRTVGSFRSQPHRGRAFERHTRPGPPTLRNTASSLPHISIAAISATMSLIRSTRHGSLAARYCSGIPAVPTVWL